MADFREFLGFGVIGNFANHLQQAGEAEDFKHIAVEDCNAPKGIFPFYIPQNNGFLGRFCIDCQSLIIPQDAQVQAEPELALICNIEYENKSVKNIIPTHFAAFNDASIRNFKNATKLSQKKNFSSACKGIGAPIELVGDFSKNGMLDSYSLTSFVIIDGKAHQYGNNTKVTNYNYFYSKLINWMKITINNQRDSGVLEDLSAILKANNYPKNAIFSIGATSYAPFGEDRYLQKDDEICICLYNHKEYINWQIRELLEGGACEIPNVSIVRQKIQY